MIHDAARSYLDAGLCVLPADRAAKFPKGKGWRKYQKRLPTEAELDAWLANGPDALCILCGAVSGNFESIDFDAGGELFEAWKAKIPEDLFARLVIERTPSGGYHADYRCEAPVCGSLKLAQRKTDDGVETLIETRGQGGLVVCAPTEGYELIQGDLCNLPVLTEAERDILLRAAWELNEYVPAAESGPSGGVPRGPTLARGAISDVPLATDRPGDDFNARGDVGAILADHGWTYLRTVGDNAHWSRPGKNPPGTSATLRQDGVFFVFSSNAAPFEPQTGYSPFSVYAMLACGGDFEQAARSLRESGYGGDPLADNADGTDISAIMRMSVAPDACPSDNADVGQTTVMCDGEPEPEPEIADPGPMAADMLRVPGFIGEVMDHTLAIAPYPNQVMAFGGALALQAFLAGRKVRDPGDNRTNLYLLGLAHSGAGKDQSRKVNSDIIHAIGLGDCLGLHFASGEGIQDALFQTPTMLFQTDEIDGMLQSINKAKDGRHEAIMGTLLTMYSSANSVYPMRRKAGKESPGVIDQPCLVIYGTAIPNHYYQALSERMLTNGFFARTIVLEAGPRAPGQEPLIRELPQRVLATARWWADYRPGTGNLEDRHPVPTIVEQSDDAKRLLVETRLEAEAEYSRSEEACDAVGTTVWGRVSEQVRKLALLYAISESYQSPHIGLAAVEWASRFVTHQTRRMLFMAASHVADNPFHAECLKLLGKLRDAPGNELPHSKLLQRMKIDAKSLALLIETLAQQGDIEVITIPRAGSAHRSYRLRRGVRPGGETSVGGEW